MKQYNESLQDAISVTVDALEYNHPTAIITTDTEKKCDIRVEPIDKGILVTAYKPYSITDEDISTIVTSSIDIGDGVGEEYVLITQTITRTDLV